jgi:hypothetical protein
MVRRTITVRHKPGRGRPRFFAVLSRGNAYFHVRVKYDGGLSLDLDEALFRAAGNGKPLLSHSSGCCIFPPYTRDHEWDFTKLSQAKACFERIQAVLKPAKPPHEHPPLPKRSVELWDEKPRLITALAIPESRGFQSRIPAGAPAKRRKRRAA